MGSLASQFKLIFRIYTDSLITDRLFTDRLFTAQANQHPLFTPKLECTKLKMSGHAAVHPKTIKEGLIFALEACEGYDL